MYMYLKPPLTCNVSATSKGRYEEDFATMADQNSDSYLCFSQKMHYSSIVDTIVRALSSEMT